MAIYIARINTDAFGPAITDSVRVVLEQRGVVRVLLAAGYAPPLVETIIRELGQNGAAAILQDESIVEVTGESR